MILLGLLGFKHTVSKAVPFFATRSYASISGYVKDNMENPVGEATIIFIDESNPVNVFSSITDSVGRYEIDLTVSVDENAQNIPTGFTLHQNYPNPFNPTTVIPFSLYSAGFVELTIYNVLGQKVKTLINSYQSAGSYAFTWNGLDKRGINAGAGTYIYQLKIGGRAESKKMLLLDGGVLSVAGGSSHLLSNSDFATKPGVTLIDSANKTYRVTITGEGIDPFDKSGVSLLNAGPTVDFFVSRAGSGFHLTILHTNDIHAHFMPYNIPDFSSYDVNVVTSAEEESYGGSARIAAMSGRLRNQRQNVLFVDAGDQFPFKRITTYNSEAEQLAMNLLGYDIINIGNRDFDFGPSFLVDFINGLNFPVVSANINVMNEPSLNGLFEPYRIVEFGDRKVGILGFVTESTPMTSNPGENVLFEDIVTSVQNTVNELKNQGVNIIIALGHEFYFLLDEIAASVDGLDIIIGGHQHILLSNTDETALGPYPTIIESLSGEPVLIVQTPCYNKYLGSLNITFDDDGIVTYWSGQPYPMDNSVPHDMTIFEQLLEKYEELQN